MRFVLLVIFLILPNFALASSQRVNSLKNIVVLETLPHSAPPSIIGFVKSGYGEVKVLATFDDPRDIPYCLMIAAVVGERRSSDGKDLLGPILSVLDRV